MKGIKGKNVLIKDTLKEYKNIPTILIILGATGDLIEKKIAPALFHLFENQNLPSLFKIIGVARREFSDEQFQNSIREIILKHLKTKPEEEKLNKFLEIFSYHQIEFQDKAGYQDLAKTLGQVDNKWQVCSNKLFYLAVPPPLYELIFTNLAQSGLTKPCSEEEDWTRVLVEKPFGKDLKTSQGLDTLLGKLFKEEQIYRIDHYLAKEMIQNILAFRFSNDIFEQNWDNRSIEKINIRLFEAIGVEDRGNFYDGLGALRDVGQNHLLQMLALVTMSRPHSFETNAIREKRAEILNTLKIPSTEEIKENTFRAQYEGYKNIAGVDPNSATETYFKIRAFLNSPVWQNVPIILESGKRLKEQRKEIEIIYKHVQPCLCPPGTDVHFRNKVIISLEPENGISINFWSKKPGLEFKLDKRTFNFLLHQEKERVQYTEEYEKLLFDAIAGDQTLFVSTEEVAAMWQFIDPVISGWQENLTPLKFYSPDTDQPIKESMFIDETKVYKKIDLKKEIGVVGLGKMGSNIAGHLMEKGWEVAGFNRSPEPTQDLIKEGLNGAFSLQEFMDKLSPSRLIWLMIPAGKTVDEIIFGQDGLVNYLKPGDIVLDGGNSFYSDSVERYKKLKKFGINFLDVGVSGGPEGARYGASLMIGGERKIFEKIEPLFADLAKTNGYQFFDGAGAGHFVKMIHNGIEYGMMQAIAEGFNILKSSGYKIDLTKVADVYNHGSVIESRLIRWLKDAFELHGQDLKNVSGIVGHTGEGEWTVKTAREQNLKLKVIEDALKFRIESQKNQSYAGKILSALREQFGGHKK